MATTLTSPWCVGAAWASCLLCLAAGCGDRNYYQLKLTPHGDGLERDLVCWRKGGAQRPAAKFQDFPPDELARLTKLYDQEAPADAEGRHHFHRRFAEKLPADVGGAGHFLHWETTLGSLSIYGERMRGSDDIELALERRREAVTDLCDLASDWFAAEVSDDKLRTQCQVWINGRLKRDLKNLAHLYWLASAEASQRRQSGTIEMGLRAAQYLSEHGYVQPAELAALNFEADERLRIFELIQRAIARGIGLTDDQSLPNELDFLTATRVEGSWRTFVSKSKRAPLITEKWRALGLGPAKDALPEDASVERWLPGLAFPLPFGSFDEVTVQLHCGVRPFITNGRWDTPARCVRWEAELRPGDVLPPYAMALWSEPNESYQESQFGRVILTQSDLARYVHWRRTLGEADGLRWEAALARLSPGDKLKADVEALKLPKGGKGDDLAETARSILLEALNRSVPGGT